MGNFLSTPSASDVFGYPENEEFAETFFIGGVKLSGDKIKLDQTRGGDAKIDSKLLFGSKEDRIHLGKKPFQYTGAVPREPEPLTTLRASLFVQRTTIRLIKDVNECDPIHRSARATQPLLNRFLFNCKFDADVPGEIILYQRATESFTKDNKLSFTGTVLGQKAFDKGNSIEFESETRIDHEGLVREQSENWKGKAEIPLLLHIIADEKYHPGHSHAVHMKVECVSKAPADQYAIKIEKINQCNNGVVYLMQEIYNAENRTELQNANANDENAIVPAENFACTICLDRPMDSVLLPCRHLAFCNECAPTMKQHNSLCPFCRKPYLVVLQIFFLKHKKECSQAEIIAAKSLAQSLEKQVLNNTYNNSPPGSVSEDMVRLPIGLVVCPPPKNPGDAPISFGGTGGDLGGATESLPRQLSLRSAISPTERGGMQPFSQMGMHGTAFMGDYGHTYSTTAGTLAGKYNIAQGIYEKDEHRNENETIQRNTPIVTPGQRPFAKVPLIEDTTDNTYGSYEVVDHGVKLKTSPAASYLSGKNSAEIHMVPQSMTPVSARKAKEMSGKQKKQQPTPHRDLPPPPPALLQDEDPEERNRTLVNPGSATPGSRGDSRGAGHRAEFSPVNAGTVKRDTHRSDIYEQPPNLERQVKDHKQQQQKKAAISDRSSPPVNISSKLEGNPQSLGNSNATPETAVPPFMHSGISLKSLPRGGKVEKLDSRRYDRKEQPTLEKQVMELKQQQKIADIAAAAAAVSERNVIPANISVKVETSPQSKATSDTTVPTLLHSGISLKSLPRGAQVENLGGTHKQSHHIGSQNQPSDISRSLQNTSTNASSLFGERLRDQEVLLGDFGPRSRSAISNSPVLSKKAPNYINLEPVTPTAKTPDRPPKSGLHSGKHSPGSGKEGPLSPAPPPVPARGPSMLHQQKITPTSASVIKR